jgi:hypothetical protein
MKATVSRVGCFLKLLIRNFSMQKNPPNVYIISGFRNDFSGPQVEAGERYWPAI